MDVTIGSLFSGIEGLGRGAEMAVPGARIAWQAEIDPHARAVLERAYPAARRYADVREIDERAERPTIICGGFPCQDISLAGAGAGIDGPKSGLWAEFARIVRVLRPDIVFVENVAALLGRGLDRVLGDLAALGFDAEWETFLASDVGAPHRRDRLFLLAYTDRERVRQLAERDQRGWRGARAAERRDAEPVHDRAQLANASSIGHEAGTGGPRRSAGRSHPESGSGGQSEDDLADSHGGRREVERIAQPRRVSGASGGEPDGRRDDRRIHRFPPGPSAIAGWDGPQPAVRRGDDGVPGRSHRLRLLGNAVVPQQAALAWETLMRRVLA